MLIARSRVVDRVTTRRDRGATRRGRGATRLSSTFVGYLARSAPTFRPRWHPAWWEPLQISGSFRTFQRFRQDFLCAACDHSRTRRSLMTRKQRYQYEMLARVCDFGKTHQQLFAQSEKGHKCLAEIAAAIVAIDESDRDHVLGQAEASPLKTATRRSVYRAMQDLTVVARRMTRLEPGVSRFRLPRHRNLRSELSTARMLLQAAEPREADLTAFGLPASVHGPVQGARGRPAARVGGAPRGHQPASRGSGPSCSISTRSCARPRATIRRRPKPGSGPDEPSASGHHRPPSHLRRRSPRRRRRRRHRRRQDPSR